MEDPDRRSFAKIVLDSLKYLLEVLKDHWPVVRRCIMHRILAMIARVEYNNVEVSAERPPKRHISIDRESIAVAECQSRSAWIAVAPQTNLGPVPHGQRD